MNQLSATTCRLGAYSGGCSGDVGGRWLVLGAILLLLASSHSLAEHPLPNRSAPSHQAVGAGEVRRLPPVVPQAEPPRVLRLAADEDGASVSMASGAVTFAPPRGWNVSELPLDREVRLLLTPGEPPQSIEAFTDGIWMTYRSWPHSEKAEQEELTGWMRRRLGQVLPPATKLSELRDCEIGSHRGLVQTFRVNLPPARSPAPDLRANAGAPAGADSSSTPDRPGNRSPDSNSSPALSPDDDALGQSHVGVHLLARTGQGMFELHLRSPEDVFPRRKAALVALLETLSLEQPDLPPQAIAREVAAAAAVIGRWKALGGTLVLSARGRVALHFDRKRIYALDSEGNLDYQSKVQQLTGNFTAQGDVIRIRWDDGSLLNLRWRLRQGRLYVTDHLGTVSQLERLF